MIPPDTSPLFTTGKDGTLSLQWGGSWMKWNTPEERFTVAFLTAFFACVVIIALIVKGDAQPLWNWLDKWQTLAGAILAVLAASWTVWQMRKQTTLLARQARFVALTYADEAMERAESDRKLIETITRIAHSAQTLALLARAEVLPHKNALIDALGETKELLSFGMKAIQSSPHPTGWHTETIQSRDALEHAIGNFSQILTFFDRAVGQYLQEPIPNEAAISLGKHLSTDILSHASLITERIHDHHIALGLLRSELEALHQKN